MALGCRGYTEGRAGNIAIGDTTRALLAGLPTDSASTRGRLLGVPVETPLFEVVFALVDDDWLVEVRLDGQRVHAVTAESVPGTRTQSDSNSIP